VVRRFKYRLADTIAYLMVAFILALPTLFLAFLIWLVVEAW